MARSKRSYQRWGLPCRAAAFSLACRVAEDLDCVVPILFPQCDRVWFTNTVPHCDHANLQTTFKATAHTAGERMGKAWHVGIDIGRLLTAAIYRGSAFPGYYAVLPDTTRSFTTFINQNSSALWNVFYCSKGNGKSRLYGIWSDLQVKARLFLCCISIMCSVLIVFGQTLFKCFNFQNKYSKIFQNFPVTS
jgi:hypothetical protein